MVGRAITAATRLQFGSTDALRGIGCRRPVEGKVACAVSVAASKFQEPKAGTPLASSGKAGSCIL
jgi:hypothetical protein